MKKLLTVCLAIAATLPAWAASAKKPLAFVADLSPQTIRHGELFPLPSKGPCVIKKPVGMRYRLLTAGVDLEDKGDYWIADFSRSKGPATGSVMLRVVGENGDQYDIEVHFPRPVIKAKPTPAKQEPAAVKAPAPAP